MTKPFQKIRLALLACFLASLLAACLDSSDSNSGSTDTGSENNPTNQDSNQDSDASEFYVITADNMETLRQRITRLMSQNQVSVFHTRNELNPIFLATVLRDHLNHLNSDQTNEALTAAVCPQSGSVSLDTTNDVHTFTYNQCRTRNEFDSSNPFIRDGVIKMTNQTSHWLVELDLKFQTTKHEGSLEFTYTDNLDYSLKISELTRTPDNPWDNIIFLENVIIDYKASADRISISGIYGEESRDEYSALPSGKVEISSSNLNKLHDNSRGTVTLKGANNTQATIDFSSGSPVIQLDD